MSQTCRLYDDDYQPLGEWPQVPADELKPGRHVVIDWPDGRRWSGTITKTGGPPTDTEGGPKT